MLIPAIGSKRVILQSTFSVKESMQVLIETGAKLVASIARGRRWLDEIAAGKLTDVEQIATREKCSVRKVNRTISLAFLAPDLVKAAVEGRLPRGIGVAPSLRLPGRVVASVPESSAFQVRRPPRVVTHRPAAHALAQQPCYHNHVDHGVIVVSQSNSSRISCMQTGLCRMRTESLAAAFTVHRETDFGRERRKAPNRPRAVFIRRRDRTPGISTAETPAKWRAIGQRHRETPVRLRGGPGGLEPPTRPL
jgi:hypothetical protein